MPCYHPFRAWRSPSGAVQLSKNTVPDAAPLALRCGGCLGCRTDKAREWALRCQLEQQQHKSAVFTTLTFSDDHVPLTLDPTHLALFHKRLRRAVEPLRYRHFGSGEYGETTARPHYHAILFGLDQHHAKAIEKAWGQGYTLTEPVTPARIAYCAGYVNKKIGYRREPTERVDEETGEVYTWRPPFLQMSRNPGIGGDARKHTTSWRTHAVFDGVPMKTPRYYHEAWKKTATAEMLEKLEYDRSQYLQRQEQVTPEQREASERIAAARQAEKARKRKL